MKVTQDLLRLNISTRSGFLELIDLEEEDRDVPGMSSKQ